MSGFADKVAELGPIAYYLIHLLSAEDRALAADLLRQSNISDAWSLLQGYAAPAIRKFTLGFFYTAVPCQVPLSDKDFVRMFADVYPRVFGFKSVSDLLRASASKSNWCPVLHKEAYYKLFPYKPVADSQHKLNIYFSELVLSVKECYPKAYSFINRYRSFFFCDRVAEEVRVLTRFHSLLLPSVQNGPIVNRPKSILYNDQASAILLYYVALAGDSEDVPLLLHAVVSVYRPDVAKALSIVVKNSGSNATLLGAKLCEAQTLTGRGVGSCDLWEEARYRCDPARCAASTWHCDFERLRLYIRQILEEELKDQEVEFEPLDQFWHRRWQWCVNGSHSAVLGRHDPRFKVRIPGVTQVHRRCVVEQIKDEPISGWNGESYFTGSLKLEHGKMRALFACDTLTYFAFEHLLRPVEKKWHGYRVLLDPGRGGMLRIVDRIRTLQRHGSCNVMVDFEDFNSQHTLEAQKILFEELINLVGYDPVLGDKLIRSFDHMNCYVDGKRVGHMYGTLCSGHRATTFINSVLNAAYIAYVLGSYNGYGSMHVGDDVYVACSGLDAAAVIVDSLYHSSLRINPMKQSVGVHAAEFLRMAVSSTAAYGYVARSISSAISGNWLTLHRQNPREFLQSMVEHAWTLANRSADLRLPMLLVRSVSRVTRFRRKIIRDLLLGRVALGNGPVRASDSDRVFCYSVVEDLDKRGRFMSSAYYDTLTTLPHYASSDFLAHCTSELERDTLVRLGISVTNMMISTSYDKTLSTLRDTDDYKAFRLVKNSRLIGRACKVGTLVHSRGDVDVSNIGVLNRYPILTQLRNYLNAADVRLLLAEIGGIDVLTRPLEEVAWGLIPHTLAVDGYLPYSDAVSYSTGVDYDYVRSDFPVHM